jgi:hypothetical protein
VIDSAQVVQSKIANFLKYLRVLERLFTNVSRVKMNSKDGFRYFLIVVFKFLSANNSPIPRKVYNEFAMFLNCCEKGVGNSIKLM